MTATKTAPDAPPQVGDLAATPRLPGWATGTAAVLALVVAVVLVGAWHLTQGTSDVGPRELLGLLTGSDGDVAVRNILVGSRLPRLAAGVSVGFALGVAGALFQSISRNPLASPDTLAVTAGSYLAIVAVAAFGLTVPFWASGAVAFAGGLAAAALVLGLAGGAGAGGSRLVLAGAAVAMALQAAVSALLILFQTETTGLFAWGSGSLSQLDLTAFWRALPVVVIASTGGLLLSRRLDVLGLGDDTAGALGVPVRATRAIGVLLAVVLTAAAITLAGPIGFVGLAAPVVARLLSRVVPALNRHAFLLPTAGLLGSLVVVLADAVVRSLLGAQAALAVPTGVATTMVGAVIMVLLARQLRDAGPTRRPPAAVGGPRSTRRFVLVLTSVAVLAVVVVVAGLLAGSTWLRTGDIALWMQGEGPAVVRFALDERAPRVAAAVVAGAALALSGTMVQATARNPLAEPGILGITGGAGLGAVIVVTTVAGTAWGNGIAAGTGATLIAAVIGGMLAFALVYLLAWRSGLLADRLVLVGIGLWNLTAALTTFLLLRSDPWNTPRIYTWLSGTTYGRDFAEVLPLLVLLALAIPLATSMPRELDLLALDDDTPQLVGIGLERTRLLVLAAAAALAATSVTAVGVVGFVGLVAPHAARALVGGRHARVLPVAMLLGAVFLGLADLLGRTVIAPAQLPAGLVVALLGAPYFVWLLARSRH
ncbi:transport system permease protein [Xylanimonas cellulosilytica DSM 15894]|uniref:Transport system permease protein n=1 Tax=Xylanimonas cellulosilytica (strain DSM 15894 / JCM 12276 / CECT 5975 / KCTC 9989 / LMG 20990 / NBRC 107835 / XIL07) TaxID=446471 RepID=D1BZS8_XYLCX|nr:iron ABC transporter permease [Xylanimonas cellulosilytica]ACZ32056.1 transport system permease protein [Xylanimonas cellulosilytica DSM 15894]